MKDKIKRWYDLGLWSAAMVQNAVDKGALTADEAEEITAGGSGE